MIGIGLACSTEIGVLVLSSLEGLLAQKILRMHYSFADILRDAVTGNVHGLSLILEIQMQCTRNFPFILLNVYIIFLLNY